MFGNNVLGIIFAYAHEERVRDLTELRVMASVPFGGRYRLVPIFRLKTGCFMG